MTASTTELTFIQTADAYLYSKLIDQTSLTVKEYARRHDARYEAFLGVKKGGFPWQATFNRIFMLDEMIRRGVQGWVCYLDADAWIADLDFDLRAYIAEHAADAAAIFTPSGASDLWWDVNAGVFLINLDHPFAVELVGHWLRVSLEQWYRIDQSPGFPVGGPDDQSILHEILAAFASTDVIHLASRDVINSQRARFIQQHLRADQQNFNVRVHYIRDQVETVLQLDNDKGGGATPDPDAWAVTEALYVGLLGREPDGGVDNPYYRSLLRRGLRDGAETALRNILGSEEYRSRQSG